MIKLAVSVPVSGDVITLMLSLKFINVHIIWPETLGGLMNRYIPSLPEYVVIPPNVIFAKARGMRVPDTHTFPLINVSAVVKGSKRI